MGWCFSAELQNRAMGAEPTWSTAIPPVIGGWRLLLSQGDATEVLVFIHSQNHDDEQQVNVDNLACRASGLHGWEGEG